MNLASQSVLEGLNACLDHRGEVSMLSSLMWCMGVGVCVYLIING